MVTAAWRLAVAERADVAVKSVDFSMELFGRRIHNNLPTPR
jgi:hypothetical protein